MKKTITSEQKLKNLIKENNPILNTLLLERIKCILDITLTDIEENPEVWNNSIIHPNLYKELANNARITLL